MIVFIKKNEPPPTLKASIRLLRVIFSAGVGVPEYQRQVATPNVPKFTAAIIGLAEKHEEEELRVLILETLTRLVPLYPTLHRASHSALSALSLRFLNGSAPQPTNNSLLEAASGLYSVLHYTGGKVGAANLWRKSVDETLAFAWTAFSALRTTFPFEADNVVAASPSIDEALITIPLNLDRLRCCTVVLCDLLSSTTQRPVQVPLGPIIKFISALLSCTKDDNASLFSFYPAFAFYSHTFIQGREHADPAIQAMELSILPNFWKLSCDVITCLAKCACHHLTPHLTRLLSYLTFHLEQKPIPSQRLFLLSAIQHLLTHCHVLDSPLVPTRLAKAVLPSLSIILATPSDVQRTEVSVAASQKSRKGKKRARGYEGDEVFKLSRDVICPGSDEGRVLLITLEVMRLLLRNPNLSPALQSISARVLLSMLLALPQISPASLSPDLKFHNNLLQSLQSVNTELGSGSTSVMSKSLGLIVRATLLENSDDTFRNLEYLLHPRVPPLVRSLPHVESLSLFRAEEPQEEADVREELGLQGAFPDRPITTHDTQDVVMEDDSRTAPKINDENPVTIHGQQPPAKPVPAVPTISNVNVQQAAAATLPRAHVEPPRPQPAVIESAPARPVIPPQHAAVPAQEEDEDEEMPAINMDSDSDEY
ncbi:hypothetical protein D9615_000575 [Tricholomella constricta]|uniref:Pre-rRNA-processing protein RIX1 n=1 Tax=Tricholomella constricta TaxID=117010 RepID=A0A8H5HQK4_9AGAR|nr:hypothetical protein D9615_000575 [Tricholomella constricta]